MATQALWHTGKKLVLVSTALCVDGVGATIAMSNDLAMALKLFTTVNLRLVHDSINAASIVFDRIMNIHYGDWIKEVLRNQK
nr:putative abc1 protein [Quercus suber]